MIPAGWSIEPLGELVRVQGGNAFKSVLFGASGVPVVRISSIQNGVVSLQDAPLHPYDAGLKRFELIDGDLLIAMSGATTGKLGRYRKNDPVERAYLNQRVGRFMPKSGDSRDLDFCWYVLQTERVQIAILGDSIGGAQPNVSGGEIERVLVKIPPQSERWEIAETLKIWDRAIETVEALIANARAQKQALMQQLLPQGTTPPKKRLPGFSVDWQEVRLGDLVKEVSRDVEWNDDATYKLISVRRRSEGIFHRESLSGHEILTKSMKVARAGDFLMSKMQILHGASALVEADFDGFNISGSYVALVPRDPAKLDIGFFNWYSRTPYFYKLTYISSSGVHIEKMTFNLKSFLKKTILVPSVKAEQSAIVERLNSANGLIEKYQEQAAALREEKAALMQQLLTGKRRVKLPESEVV